MAATTQIEWRADYLLCTNNAYLVFMDAAVERKVEAMHGPDGPIQWVGGYHPYYKMPHNLLVTSGTEPIKVRVTVVDRFAETHAASKVTAMGDVASTMTHAGQKTYEMEVCRPPSPGLRNYRT